MGARTYCQDIGRFLQPDPLFEAFARHTPYHYSFNSPLVWLDPSGLAPEKEKGEERLQAILEPIIFEQMEQVYSYQIIIMKSRLTEMMIRSEILGILKTISDSYYGGDIPDNGDISIGSARVAWSAGAINGNYWMDVNVSQDGIEVQYSESGTIGKNGQLNISSISISTTNITLENVAGWLSGVNAGIKGAVANKHAPWMSVAKKELGVQEIKGPVHNQRIIQYHSKTSAKSQSEVTPWCSSYVNWCLAGVGISGTNSASSQSWNSWDDGYKLDNPAFGAIAVFKDLDNPKRGHVTFVAGINKNGQLIFLGGNQSDAVSYHAGGWEGKKLIGYFYPNGYNPTYTLPILNIYSKSNRTR